MNKIDDKKLRAAINYLDSWLDYNFKDSNFIGLQVAIQHNDKIVYSKSFGHANIERKEKLTDANTFRIASHSKTFTATAIMQLKENGKLGLDDPVNKYLDWFKSSKDERVAEITIRQLLNHTSGIIRDGEEADYWNILRPFPEIAELKQYVSDCKLVYDSDDKFKYSNYGFGYLGQVIEAVSGVSYASYVTSNIINKLGLKSTGPELDAKAEQSLATPYGMDLFNRKRRAFKQIDTKGLAAATGFYSNASDVCRYFAAHFLGDSSLLNDYSKRMMQHGYWEAEQGEEYYGLGFDNIKKKGWTLYGHGGGFPGFITNTKFDPQKKLVVTVLSNMLGGPISKINKNIINIIDKFQNDRSPKLIVNKPEKFTGRFYSKWGAADIILAGNKLICVNPRLWSDFEYCEQLSIVDDNTLRIEEASGYHSPGETVKYVFDSNQRVKKLVYAGHSLVTWEEALKFGWF